MAEGNSTYALDQHCLTHSSHVANSRLNSANGFISKYFKILMFFTLNRYSEPNSNFLVRKKMFQGIKTVNETLDLKAFYTQDSTVEILF